MSVVLFNLETCLETKWKRYVSHTIILNSVFPCISWFKWWVVGNLLCRPLKSLSLPPTPSVEGTEPFSCYERLAALQQTMRGSCFNNCCFSTVSNLQPFSCNINWKRRWTTWKTWDLMDNSCSALCMPPTWSYDVSLPAAIRQWSLWKTKFSLPFFNDFISCLTHSRECGCSIRLGLLAWQDDMWDHPCALKKECADRVIFKWAHHENFSDNAFQIFQLDPRADSVVFLWDDV